MKKRILSIRPPQFYEDNFVEYVEGLDNYPDLPNYLQSGYTRIEASKMELLIHIEHMKKILKENVEEMSSEEEKELRNYINEMTQEYNQIHD